MSRFSSLLCSLLFCMITYAQEITVTGKVTAGGEEMPGVTVAVKGQTRGTITSIDGSYQIQVNGNESLIFSFVGYELPKNPHLQGLQAILPPVLLKKHRSVVYQKHCKEL